MLLVFHTFGSSGSHSGSFAHVVLSTAARYCVFLPIALLLLHIRSRQALSRHSEHSCLLSCPPAGGEWTGSSWLCQRHLGTKNSSQAGTDITLKPYRLEPVCINITHAQAHTPPHHVAVVCEYTHLALGVCGIHTVNLGLL